MGFLREVCFFIATLSLVQASCSFTEKTDIVTQYGTRLSFCEYQGLKMLTNSTFVDLDRCVKVTCSVHVMSLCGYGINSGRFAHATGCKIVSDGCEPIYVNDPNADVPCRES